MSKMRFGDKIDGYANRVEKCIPKIIKNISLSVPGEVGNLRLTVSQSLTLANLFREEIWRMGELAESGNVSLGAMTGIVDGLIQSGFVERKRDINDRRSVLVYLTPQGKKIARKIQSKRREKLRRAIISMDEEKRETIINGFEKAIETFSTVR